MKRTFAAALLALVIAACSRREADEPPPLAYPKGPWQQLNPGLWSWGPNDLIQPRPGSAAATGLALSDRAR